MKHHAQFSDVSSIMDDYVLIQNQGGPSELRRKSSSTLNQEAWNRCSPYERYKAAENIYHIDERVQAFKHELKTSWGEAISQLQELHGELFDDSSLNPAIEATSRRAFLTALFWLVKTYSEDRSLPCPDIVPSGDGGIDIEWTFDDRFVSAQIHKSNPANDRIYFRFREGFQSTELKMGNLLSLLQK